MQYEKYINFYGYGIRDKNFSNSFNDKLILTMGKRGDFKLSKSTSLGNTTQYVRFITEEDANNFIINYLDKDPKLSSNSYESYKVKVNRNAIMIDNNYHIYITKNSDDIFSIPPYFDKDGVKLSDAQTLDTMSIDNLYNILNSNMGSLRFDYGYKLDQKIVNTSFPLLIKTLKSIKQGYDDINSELHVNVSKIKLKKDNKYVELEFKISIWHFNAYKIIDAIIDYSLGTSQDNEEVRYKLYDTPCECYRPIVNSIKFTVADFKKYVKTTSSSSSSPLVLKDVCINFMTEKLENYVNPVLIDNFNKAFKEWLNKVLDSIKNYI